MGPLKHQFLPTVDDLLNSQPGPAIVPSDREPGGPEPETSVEIPRITSMVRQWISNDAL